ncbi:MAG: MotA/TolQ/ExbB proton channel family protein [Verrucomicrobia bacterium]|nr:MAG: MotA/TolQ/ExbB proton channel family protein [Verrucomicrobiota bacterium]
MYVSVLHASAAGAATPLAGTAAPHPGKNFLEVVISGGIMIYPLALLSVVGVVLILIYLLTIRRNAIVSDHFMHEAEAMIRRRDYLGLIAFSQRRNECIARITQKTLTFVSSNPGNSFENVREVAQTEGSRQAGVLTSRIAYLADIGAIAPMVGLLGTVLGMIEAFIEISSGEVQGVRQMGLAEGVSKALIATAGGLCISILALAFYSIFRGRVQKYISELEAAATHLIALLHAQFERQSLLSATSSGQRSRETYAVPDASLMAGERRDLHGI